MTRAPESRRPRQAGRLLTRVTTPSWRGNLGAAGLFALLAVAWTFPLILHLGTSLLGAGAGDNITGLWNVWWMRTALGSGQDFFRTSYLFAPVGVDLTLDTHTALAAFVGATLLAPMSLVAAMNVTILAALFLNGWCAYRLATRFTADRGAAFAAGLVFGGSTYITAHLNGHFNLVSAWTLPLFALAVVEALRGSVWWGVVAGTVLGGTAYVDYYYLVFEAALGLCLVACAARQWSITRGDRGRLSDLLTHALAAAVVGDVLLIVIIAATGDLSLTIGSRRVLLGTYNPLQVLWALAALWVVLRTQPRVRTRRRAGWKARRSWPPAAMAMAVSLGVAAPLVWKGARLALRGDYVSQHYFWRSAPPGVDLASLLVGNPFHALWGPAIQHLYARWGINLIESGGGWLGAMPLLLAAWSLRRRWSDEAVRHWAAIGVIFLLWAFGPHLAAFGRATGMILPEAVFRWVPVVSNARMPGRAVVVVDLAVAMLGAVALAAWRAQSRWPNVLLAGAASLVAIDLLPAPFPVVALDHPALYDVLRDRPERGAVCELPLGARDGFGELGELDHRVLFYQTIHGRPIVGGFVARLPPSVIEAYRADPLISALLRLSAPTADSDASGPTPDRQSAAALFRRDGIRFVVLNRATASRALIGYVVHELPLTLIQDDGARALYVTDDWSQAGPGSEPRHSALGAHAPSWGICFSLTAISERVSVGSTLKNSVVWIPDSKTPNGIGEAPLTELAQTAFEDLRPAVDVRDAAQRRRRCSRSTRR
jgi:hypothetical protein